MRLPRLVLLLLVLLPLLAPSAAAAERSGACPDALPRDASCRDRLLRPGRDHLVLVARAAGGEAHAAYREPLADEDEPAPPALEAGYARHAEDGTGETVALVFLECGDVQAAGVCAPASHFAGAHLAPLGQDARAGTSAPWKSASASADLHAAGHSARVQAGTFHFWGLQYGYVEAWVDGEPVVSFFDAMPMPLP